MESVPCDCQFSPRFGVPLPERTPWNFHVPGAPDHVIQLVGPGPGPWSRLFPGLVSCPLDGDQLDAGPGEPGDVPGLPTDIDPDIKIADPQPADT